MTTNATCVVTRPMITASKTAGTDTAYVIPVVLPQICHCLLRATPSEFIAPSRFGISCTPLRYLVVLVTMVGSEGCSRQTFPIDK